MFQFVIEFTIFANFRIRSGCTKLPFTLNYFDFKRNLKLSRFKTEKRQEQREF